MFLRSRYADDGEFGFDGLGRPLDHRVDAQLVQHFTEEAAHHEAPGDRFGDPAGEQVEQLLVVEPTGGAGVARADELSCLDLQVRYRIGPRALGEQQVPVHLVGVGAFGGGPDQHVADPDGVGRLALQRALVEHP